MLKKSKLKIYQSLHYNVIIKLKKSLKLYALKTSKYDYKINSVKFNLNAIKFKWKNLKLKTKRNSTCENSRSMLIKCKHLNRTKGSDFTLSLRSKDRQY